MLKRRFRENKEAGGAPFSKTNQSEDEESPEISTAFNLIYRLLPLDGDTSHFSIMEPQTTLTINENNSETYTNSVVAKENFERHLAAMASAAAAAAAAAVASAAGSTGSTSAGQQAAAAAAVAAGRSTNSSFLIEDILFPRRKLAVEESDSVTKETSNLSDKYSEEMPKSLEPSPELTLSRLHDYNNLAAYFSSHAAAAAMTSSAAAAASGGGFLQHHPNAVGSYLQKAHAPIPSPFFLPTGKINLERLKFGIFQICYKSHNIRACFGFCNAYLK